MIKKTFTSAVFLFSAITFAQVGINTDSPTSKLDINGDLRIRDITTSSNTSDFALVADNNGVVKKKINELKGIFRGYLTNNISSPNSTTAITPLRNFTIIDNPNNDIDSNGNFKAPISGLYKITFTATAYTNNGFDTQNTVYGFTDASTNKWILRFSLPYKTYLAAVAYPGGASNTFVGMARLEKDKTYNFAVGGGITLISNPSGESGSGIGTYFEVELIKN